ncbi:HigA family addiction module antitoxin [Asticcacaulis machinosus]|uniref:HigA family addiction module antitoxin n=1 Tax=Asticcacaulis machinosus TaxID=2984211 RepID=A0ABT5HEU9_9CAUL|nr:HigA family addiction module antitoxin [Asticcacaulis machinosus]MDC7674697.1 HigA family addiction module antitoxin [Asticcacaulis machinosus]
MLKECTHAGVELGMKLKALNMAAAELARHIKVPTNRLTEIINGQRAITGDTALRLGHFFCVGPEFWLNLQKEYEIDLAKKKLGAQIDMLPTIQTSMIEISKKQRRAA